VSSRIRSYEEEDLAKPKRSGEEGSSRLNTSRRYRVMEVTVESLHDLYLIVGLISAYQGIIHLLPLVVHRR